LHCLEPPAQKLARAAGGKIATEAAVDAAALQLRLRAQRGFVRRQDLNRDGRDESDEQTAKGAGEAPAARFAGHAKLAQSLPGLDGYPENLVITIQKRLATRRRRPGMDEPSINAGPRS